MIISKMFVAQNLTERYLMRRITIDLPPDLLGNPRGKLVVHLDEEPPEPHFNIGNFIMVQGQLYEVIYMYRLVSSPMTWRYVLEERHSVFSSLEDDLWLHLNQSCCLGHQIPRVPEFLFKTMFEAIIFFQDLPLIGATQEFDGSSLEEEGQCLSSGEVVDDDIMSLRAALERMVHSHPDIRIKVVQRTLPLAETLEEFLAMEMAADDMNISEPEELPDDLRDIVDGVNAFLRETDPDPGI